VSDSIPNIWLMQTEQDTEGLLESLQHRDPEVRRRSAVALRIIGDTDAVDPLRIMLDTEVNPQVRVAVIAALDHLAPRRTETGTLIQRSSKPQSRTERLIEYLTSNRRDAAIQAANALGDLGDKIAVPPLITVFRNQRQLPRVRLAAAEALLKMESAPAEVTLLAALRNEKWHLRRNGAAILGQLRADWATLPLAEALNDEHQHVVRTARAALSRIGTPEALRWLEKPPARPLDVKVIKRERTEATPETDAEVGSQQTMPTRPEGLDRAIAALKADNTETQNVSDTVKAAQGETEDEQDAARIAGDTKELPKNTDWDKSPLDPTPSALTGKRRPKKPPQPRPTSQPDATQETPASNKRATQQAEATTPPEKSATGTAEGERDT